MKWGIGISPWVPCMYSMWHFYFPPLRRAQFIELPTFQWNAIWNNAHTNLKSKKLYQRIQEIIQKFVTPRGFGTSAALTTDGIIDRTATSNQLRHFSIVTYYLIGWDLGHPQKFNLSQHGLVMTSQLKCRVKWLIHYQTSPVVPLKIGNGCVISSHIA